MTKPLTMTQAQRLEKAENVAKELDKVVCDLIDSNASVEEELGMIDEEMKDHHDMILDLYDKVDAIKVPEPKYDIVGPVLKFTGFVTVLLAVAHVTGFLVSLPSLLIPAGVAAVFLIAAQFFQKPGVALFTGLVGYIGIGLVVAFLAVILIPVLLLLALLTMIPPLRNGINAAVEWISSTFNWLTVRTTNAMKAN